MYTIYCDCFSKFYSFSPWLFVLKMGMIKIKYFVFFLLKLWIAIIFICDIKIVIRRSSLIPSESFGKLNVSYLGLVLFSFTVFIYLFCFDVINEVHIFLLSVYVSFLTLQLKMFLMTNLKLWLVWCSNWQESSIAHCSYISRKYY